MYVDCVGQLESGVGTGWAEGAEGYCRRIPQATATPAALCLGDHGGERAWEKVARRGLLRTGRGWQGQGFFFKTGERGVPPGGAAPRGGGGGSWGTQPLFPETAKKSEKC